MAKSLNRKFEGKKGTSPLDDARLSTKEKLSREKTKKCSLGPLGRDIRSSDRKSASGSDIKGKNDASGGARVTNKKKRGEGRGGKQEGKRRILLREEGKKFHSNKLCFSPPEGPIRFEKGEWKKKKNRGSRGRTTDKVPPTHEMVKRGAFQKKGSMKERKQQSCQGKKCEAKPRGKRTKELLS